MRSSPARGHVCTVKHDTISESKRSGTSKSSYGKIKMTKGHMNRIKNKREKVSKRHKYETIKIIMDFIRR